MPQCIVLYTLRFCSVSSKPLTRLAIGHQGIQYIFTINYMFPSSSQRVFDNWKDSPETMLPSIKKLISSGIRIWLYRYIDQLHV
jgi:hypothetical protein